MSMNQILTIVGIDQSDHLEQVHRQSTQKAAKQAKRIRQAYAHQNLIETLKAITQNHVEKN